MGRTLQTLVVVSAVTLTAGCGGDKAARAPTVSSATTSSSATSSLPSMPVLAKQHTKRGAKAFVIYYWSVVDFARATSDTSGLARLSEASCGGCNGVLRSIQEARAAGGRVVGGANKPTITGVKSYSAGGQDIMAVSASVATSPEKVDYPGSASDKEFGAQTHAVVVWLVPSADGWTVERLDVA